MKPPLTEERQERITNSVDILNESLLWHERISKRELVKERVEIVLALIAAIASIISMSISVITRPNISLLGDEWFSISAVFSIMFTALLAALIYAAMRKYHMNIHEPALFYDGEKLFLLMPKNADVEHNNAFDIQKQASKRESFWEGMLLDKYDMLTIRDMLHGDVAKMTSQEIHDTLRAYELTFENSLGNDTFGWDVEEISEIESVESDANSGLTSFAYMDSDGEEQTLQLDTYGWNSFLHWLDEQNPETAPID